MAGLKPPGPLSFDGNVGSNWQDWLRTYEFYEKATELEKKSNEVRYATFLHVAGSTAQKIAETFAFPEREEGQVSALKAKFEAFCLPKRNLSVIRYMFNSRNQKRDENLSQYLTELKALVRGCEFRDLEDELLRDRIVCGIHDSKLREKLLQVDDLTLSKCIDICNITETRPFSQSMVYKRGQSGQNLELFFSLQNFVKKVPGY